MCGLAGQVHFGGAVDVAATLQMANGIAHRGPDDHGSWIEAGQRCVLAHRRLSIIDLSPLGHQPMLDPDTGNALVFNGEIYNYRELRRQCEEAGDRFRSESDTEVILAIYRRHGVQCLQHLRGMFAIALWDARTQQLFLARDRVGKKPLNYALTHNGIVFCSELQPLARHPLVSRERDDEALELYLQFHAVPAPWSIYKQIRKLPPAHYAIFSGDGLRIEKYWEVDYREKLALTEAEALEAFEEKLTEAVRLRMIADVPLGALLSGGVDSSVVVALMAKLSGMPVRTFSIGFHEQSLDESPFAKQAAEICQTIHLPEIVSGDVSELLPVIARHHGEPYADSSAVPSFHVSQVARRHVTVVLNGDGGDELLGGYSRYAVSDGAIRLGGMIGKMLGPEYLALLMPAWAAAQRIPARLVRRFFRDFINPEMGGHEALIGHLNETSRRKLMGSLSSANLVSQWRLSLLRDAFERAGNPIDRMLWVDNHTYLPNDLLVKADIATMHCGLEGRSPLLDHELIEFCAGLPVSLKVKNRTGKYLLKKIAEKYFPHSFVHRKKMGFGIPVKRWLCGELRSHVSSVILDSTIMEPLYMPEIQTSWNRLLTGSNDVATTEAGRVWSLLMYGQWRLAEMQRT